jgi:hypothetical protein
MALNIPYLPPNPLRPRAFGGKGAEGMKKEIPSSNSPSVFLLKLLRLLCLFVAPMWKAKVLSGLPQKKGRGTGKSDSPCE